MQDYFRPHKQQDKQFVSFQMFIDQLRHRLIGYYRCTSKIVRHQSHEDSSRLVNEVNIPIHLAERSPDATTNNRCVVCSEHYKKTKKGDPNAKDKKLHLRHKTVFWCKECTVYLCISTGVDNCFKLYDTQVQYWR